MVKKDMTQEQTDVMVAFGDAVLDERAAFVKQGLECMDATINDMVLSAFNSVNDMEGPEADEVLALLQKDMKELVRRNLAKAVKRMSKGCIEGLDL